MMQAILFAFSTIVLCHASTLQFFAVPPSIKLPKESSALRSKDLVLLDSYLLGLSAEPLKGFEVKTNLFSRPRALASIRIDGMGSLFYDINHFPITVDGFDVSSLEKSARMVFGSNSDQVHVSGYGFEGTRMANVAQRHNANFTHKIQSKDDRIKAELENVYKLAKVIRTVDKDQENFVDIYRVTISGLASPAFDNTERDVAVEDVSNALKELLASLRVAYGKRVIFKIVCISHSDIAAASRLIEKSAKPKYDILESPRKMYNVYRFTSTDYPAMFMICAGTVLFISITLIYVVVAMFSADLSKDSIIYRMTMTRLKRD